MNVRTLIEQLQTCDPEAEVIIQSDRPDESGTYYFQPVDYTESNFVAVRAWDGEDWEIQPLWESTPDNKESPEDKLVFLGVFAGYTTA